MGAARLRTSLLPAATGRFAHLLGYTYRTATSSIYAVAGSPALPPYLIKPTFLLPTHNLRWLLPAAHSASLGSGFCTQWTSCAFHSRYSVGLSPGPGWGCHAPYLPSPHLPAHTPLHRYAGFAMRACAYTHTRIFCVPGCLVPFSGAKNPTFYMHSILISSGLRWFGLCYFIF